MIISAFLGAGFGLGAWILFRALFPRPAPLDAAIVRLSRHGVSANATEHLDRLWPDRAGRFASRVLRPLLSDTDALLRVIAAASAHEREGDDRQDAGSAMADARNRDALDRLVGSVGAAAAVTFTGTGLAAAGIGLPPMVMTSAAILAGVAGFLLPALLLRERVEQRRRAFRYALSSYLDLVNVILAGGGGPETALYAAADAGDGWAFAAIREALRRARFTSRTPWDTLAQLGDELGVEELRELAASIALTGMQGARIRQALAAKADSLRGHQVAETEAAAEAASERMTIPVVVLLFGFLVFVAYPAVQSITSVSSSPSP